MLLHVARSLLTVALFLGLGACSNPASDEDDNGTSGPWNVEVINNSSNSMELLRQRPCPSENEDEWNEIPMGPEGLPSGSTERFFLPQPGCFDFSASGEGCFAEGTTGPMQGGDVVTWTITDEDIVCIG